MYTYIRPLGAAGIPPNSERTADLVSRIALYRRVDISPDPPRGRKFGPREPRPGIVGGVTRASLDIIL